jgi:pimeloyl-ACP methyl ester carboxylesterase
LRVARSWRSARTDHAKLAGVRACTKTATRLRQQLREARIELIDDANHMVMIDQPEIVEKLLADFLVQ